MNGINPERGGLVTVTFVAVGMSVMIFRQVFMRVLLEGFLAARRTEIIRLTVVLERSCGAIRIDGHATDRIELLR